MIAHTGLLVCLRACPKIQRFSLRREQFNIARKKSNTLINLFFTFFAQYLKTRYKSIGYALKKNAIYPLLMRIYRA